MANHEFLLALGCTLLPLIIGLLTYIKVRAWSHPAVAFALFWFAMSFLPIAATAGVKIDLRGLLYLSAAVAAFAAPSLIMKWEGAVAIARSRAASLKYEPRAALLGAFLTLQLATLTCLVVNLSIQGVALHSIFADPLGTANAYLAARYTDRIVANPFIPLGIVANYVAAALGGQLVSRRSFSRNAAVYLAAFSPALLHVLIYADKGTIFLCAAYFFGGVIVRRIRWGETALVNIRTLKVGAIALAVLTPLMIVAMMARGVGAWSSEESTHKIVFYLRSYAFGHVFAFSDWFSHYLGNSSLMTYTDPEGRTWGFWTFMALGQYVWPGYSLPPGYFDEYFRVQGVIQTNIYTMFRGLIYDFGVVGSLIFMATFGWISALMFRSLLECKYRPIAESYYIFLAGYMYSSYIISLAIWDTAIAAAAGVLLLSAIRELFASRTSSNLER